MIYEEEMYCLYNEFSAPQTWCMKDFKKDVLRHFLSIFSEPKKKNWRYWYNRGWRIEKVTVGITIVSN